MFALRGLNVALRSNRKQIVQQMVRQATPGFDASSVMPMLHRAARYAHLNAIAQFQMRTNMTVSHTAADVSNLSSSSQSAQVNSAQTEKDTPKQNGNNDRPPRQSGGIVHALRNAVLLVLAATFAGYAYQESQEKKKGPATVTSYQTNGEIKLGGPWSGLIDSEGNSASSDDYKGKYMLIYFGFTHCPDICPTEINKMMAALDQIEKKHPEIYNYIKTVFISVDPDRDTRERLVEYSAKYHPRLRWVTGPMDKIREAAKKYRVYFSIPDDIQPGDDYLVDHSIFFYMMGRDGKFMEFFGKNTTSDEIATRMTRIIDEDLKKRPNL